MPSMSSPGKAMPQSTITMLSSYSKAVMFMPICSKPPKGMIFSFPFPSPTPFLRPLEVLGAGVKDAGSLDLAWGVPSRSA